VTSTAPSTIATRSDGGGDGVAQGVVRVAEGERLRSPRRSDRGWLMARSRGEHTTPWHVPPRGGAARGDDPAPTVAEQSEISAEPTSAVLDCATERFDVCREVDEHPSRQQSRPRLVRGTGLLTVIVIGFIAAGLSQRSSPPSVQLPPSPTAWLSAYEAAAVDNPSEVCGQLFSRQLAAAYGHAAHGSCERWFSRITSSSVKVSHLWRDGATAVLDLRLVAGHEEWAVVLDRQSNGWRAAALFGGHLLG